jgi:hypothetical protein
MTTGFYLVARLCSRAASRGQEGGGEPLHRSNPLRLIRLKPHPFPKGQGRGKPVAFSPSQGPRPGSQRRGGFPSARGSPAVGAAAVAQRGLEQRPITPWSRARAVLRRAFLPLHDMGGGPHLLAPPAWLAFWPVPRALRGLSPWC